MKHSKIKWVTLLVLVIFVAVTGLMASKQMVLSKNGSSRLAEGVTIEAIRAVESGMTEEEVIAILGGPVGRAPSVNHPDAITLTYSKPAYFAKWYPMLWVHLRNDRVFEVYAKRYIAWGSDEVGVYGAENEPQWETDLFEQTFPLKAED